MRRSNDRAAWTSAVLGKPEKRKKSKYNNVKTDGYDSKKEAARAVVLHALQKAKAISNLREQVQYELVPKQKGERAVSYFADFVYIQDGKEIVEDVKGRSTAVWVIKRKLMLHVHGIRVLVT